MRAIIVMLSVVVLAWAIGVQADSETDESSKSGATAQAGSAAVTKKFPVFVPRESGSPSTRSNTPANPCRYWPTNSR